jgi:HK97 family phage major capsid protein
VSMIQEAITGGSNPTVDLASQIGTAAKRLEDIADEMAKAKADDSTRFAELKAEQIAQAGVLQGLKNSADAQLRDAEHQAALEMAAEAKAFADGFRNPSKAHIIAGTGPAPRTAYKRGDFLYGVHEANGRDAERQAEGKAVLRSLEGQRGQLFPGDAKAFAHEDAWGKSTLGTTDATGGWVIPNAIVDEFIVPAAVENIYRQLMTVVPGVTAAAVDIPFRSAARTRAAIAAFGATKENLDLAYNGYTATMYTLARIYDIGNQFLRQSRGAAEVDVLQELAAAFAQGESFYVREGTGSSQPFGYTSALTNGPAAFRSTFSSPSDSTVAGSMAAAIAVAAGALAGRGVKPTAAVLSATSYWNMLRQGSDSAGFWFATQERNPASVAPGTLVSPFGIPVYADADADLEATSAVIDNLVVANWKKFKLYFGESYRVDSSDEAGTRWDTNLTGFRGEEEMGFDARPAVYAGYAQMITDIVP